MKKLKKDIIIIISVILAAFLLWLLHLILHNGTPAVVKVMQDGEEIASYPLWEDRTVSIPYEDGSYNLLFISGGEASISDADCPDGLCVRAHSIERDNESIICLPHKLVIQIESKEESELDAVTY